MKKFADGGIASGATGYGFNQMTPPMANPAMVNNTARPAPFKKGGKVKAKSKGKSAPAKSSASRRGDGIAVKGKTKGKMR
jgi:hypothetical protein